MQKDFITVTPDSGTGNGTVTVAASENQSENSRTSKITIAGGGISRTISINQAEAERFLPASAPNGVYILSTDGFVYKRSAWNTANNNKAVGVAVKTTNCAFVIAPDEQVSIQWGGYGTLINGCTTTSKADIAKTDYKGVQNTDAIIAQLGTSEQYAANYCRNYKFKNGKVGYLPALGELFEISPNKSEVDACMSLIGGKALHEMPANNRWKWSSTQSNKAVAWVWEYADDNSFAFDKDSGSTLFCARPFAKLL